VAYFRFRKLYQSLVPYNQDSMDMLSSIPDQDEVFLQVKNLTKTDYRKLCQNRLYWSWLHSCETTDINEKSGMTSEEWHILLKKQFLVKIFERDDDGYAIMMQSLRDIYRKGLKSECDVMRNHIIRETSTADCSVKQFSEYLNEIERYLHSCGIILKTDNEIYKTAMKVK